MAFAQTREDTCAPDVYKAVKQHLKINEFAPRQDDGNVISAACRIWSYKTNQLLAAFAYDESVEYEKRLVVLILDEKTKSVISSFRGDIGEDAVTEVGEHSLKLDTARYQLGESVRAFGIRFTSSARGGKARVRSCLLPFRIPETGVISLSRWRMAIKVWRNGVRS